MAVNPDSKIPLWVNDYYPAFYVSITDKEDDCYTRTGGSEKVHWEPLFQDLANEMDNWKNVSRNSKLQDLIPAIWQYRILGLNFGEDNSNLSEMDGYYIFNMGGFIQSTLSRAVDYYNDLVETPPASGIYLSAKITADVNTIIGYNTMENNRKSSAETYGRNIASNFNLIALFENVTPTGSASKEDMKTEIFTNLHYKQVYENLSTMPLPSGV